MAGVPRDSRAGRGGTLRAERLSPQMLAKVSSLADLASRRGQTLAQMALAWVLRDSRMTSAVIGASSVAQLEENLGALAEVDFPPEDLAEIEQILASTPVVQPSIPPVEGGTAGVRPA
ncbi:MAG: aldo/keto reductase [Chloroflexota bacterium]